MDDEIGDDSLFGRNDDSPALSPIVEIDESSVNESSGQIAEDLEDDPEKSLGDVVKTTLNLDITVENLEERLAQPETPPEVLRSRLNSLENDFEELKSFTELEKQIYHSDCIPKEKVRSLEEEFVSLNEKVQQLMSENSEYKTILEIKERERIARESDLSKAEKLHNEGMVLIQNLLQRLREDMTVPCDNENELCTSFSFMGKYAENIEEVHDLKTLNPFLESLSDLDSMLKVMFNEKKLLQDRVSELNMETLKLRRTIDLKDKEINENEQNFSLVKLKSKMCEEKLQDIDQSLAELSVAYTVSETKRVEAEHKNEILSREKLKLENEIASIQKETAAFVNKIESLMNSLYDHSEIFTNEDKLVLKSNLSFSCPVNGVSTSLDTVVEIFHKLQKKLQFMQEECSKHQLGIKRFHDHLKELEEETKERKQEMEFLEAEITKQIPLRLLELKNSLVAEENEKVSLTKHLKDANAKINDLSCKLMEKTTEMDHMIELLSKNSQEKIGLKNELLALQKCLKVDDIQTDIVIAIRFLDQLINSWDENSNLENIVSAVHGNVDLINATEILMNSHTQAIFAEVAMKYKVKLLLHDELKSKLSSELKNLKNHIDHLESENKSLRLEIKELDHIIRKEISRVDDLEKRMSFADCEIPIKESFPNSHNNGDKNKSMIITEEDKGKEEVLLKDPKKESDKLQKEINNFNKVTKLDDGFDSHIYDLNEVENFLDSWDCLEKVQTSEFIHCLSEKLLNYCNTSKNPHFKADLIRILNKFERKLIELFELNDQLLITVKSLTYNVEDCEEKFKNQEKNLMEELTKIKRLMVLEITSLDESEFEESLKWDSVEDIFSKLMHIIMRKEQEMSFIIQKHQKEEVYNFEQRIENLHNKLKSQESWVTTLESENEKMSTELSALKNLNNCFDQKLKSLSNDLNNKTLEIDSLRSKILKLTTENDSLLSDLDSSKELINKYEQSISSLEKDIKELNKEIVHKCSIIKGLELKLTSASDTEENSDKEISTSSSNYFSFKTKVKNVSSSKPQIVESTCETSKGICESSNFATESLDLRAEKRDHSTDLESQLSEKLLKETAFIKEMLKKKESNVNLSELFSRCHTSLDLLKDVIQTVGRIIFDLEMRHVYDIQSIQTTLECKNKEMMDLKISISNLYNDFIPEGLCPSKQNLDRSCQEHSFTSFMNELHQIKSECFSLANKSIELEQSAEIGQDVVQKLREAFRIVVDENHSMTKCIDELRKSLKCEEEKAKITNKKMEDIEKEKCALVTKNSLLEEHVNNLKSELFHVRKEMFSGIDIDFPQYMNNIEKVTFINNILKHYSDNQKLYNIVTDDLRFFGYQCELMLSYILSLEYKLYFAAQQKDRTDKENTLIKSQFSNQNLEVNRFINSLAARSLCPITSLNQALNMIGHVFSEYKFLKEKEVKSITEDKIKQEKILQQQKELLTLTKQNSSLKNELSRHEDSIRNLRSELRSVRSKFQRKESTGFDYTGVNQPKLDIGIQTEDSCCKRLLKKVSEQREQIDSLSAKLAKNEQLQRTLTSSPYKQVTYLEGALGQAKERIGRLNCALKEKENYNQELVEALKRHESCQKRIDEAHKEIEKLKRQAVFQVTE